MNPQNQEFSMKANLIATKKIAGAVSSIVLAPSESNTNLTGDERIVFVNFTDKTLPVAIKLSDLKSLPNLYSTQATKLTENATRATANATAISAVLEMTSNL